MDRAGKPYVDTSEDCERDDCEWIPYGAPPNAYWMCAVCGRKDPTDG